MKLSKWLFAFFFLITFSRSYTQNVSVSGIAPQWSEKVVRLIKTDNPITNQETIIDLDTISHEGLFSLKTSTSSAGQYWITVNRFRAPIFLTKNKDYSIQIIPSRTDALVDTWQKGSFSYVIENLDTLDLNAQIAAYDDAYYTFYVDNASLIGSSAFRKNIIHFEQNVHSSSNAFVNKYISYSIAEMKLAAGYKRDELYDTYLSEQPISIDNPSYYDFFDKFYADYFNSYDGIFGGEALYNTINRGLTGDSLEIILSEDPFLKVDSIRQLVILKSLAENANGAKYDRSACTTIAQHILNQAANAQIAKLAEDLVLTLQSLPKVSSKALLSKYSEESVEIDDSKITLIVVCFFQNAECSKEMLVVEKLFEEYHNFFQIVELKEGDEKISSNRTHLTLRDSYKFLNDFEIFGMPHFIWIDPSGEIENAVEKPSEGMEARLFKLKKQAELDAEIKIGQ